MEGGAEEKLLEWSKEEEEATSTRPWPEPKKLWRVGGAAILIITLSQDIATLLLSIALFVRFANGLLLGIGSACNGGSYVAKHLELNFSWIVLSVTATFLLSCFIHATPILRHWGQDEELSAVSLPIALWFITIVCSYVFYVPMQMYLQAQLKKVMNFGIFFC